MLYEVITRSLFLGKRLDVWLHINLGGKTLLDDDVHIAILFHEISEFVPDTGIYGVTVATDDGLAVIRYDSGDFGDGTEALIVRGLGKAIHDAGRMAGNVAGAKQDT